mgnify:CR=1 FL=1
MRKIKRNIAKVNMKKAGLSKICKKDFEGNSYFSIHWREFI